MYTEKNGQIEVMAQRMKTGLSKLIEAAASVDILKQELAVKEREIAVATEDAEKVLVSVLASSEIANKIKEEASIVMEKAETLVANISVDQQEAEKKLLAAKPALDAAEAALLVRTYSVSHSRQLHPSILLKYCRFVYFFFYF